MSESTSILAAEIAALRQEVQRLKSLDTNNCPDCMTNENAIGEGVRCARHEIEFLRASLASVTKEKEEMDSRCKQHWGRLNGAERRAARAETLLQSKGPPWNQWASILDAHDKQADAQVKELREKLAQHEGCVTPCQSIAIQQENHNSYLAMKDRAEKAERDLGLAHESFRKLPAWKAMESQLREAQEALREISLGEGPFSRDHLTHATNTIEAMKGLALKVLAKPQEAA